MRRPTSSLHPPFVRLVVSTVVPALCRAADSIAHRRGGLLFRSSQRGTAADPEHRGPCGPPANFGGPSRFAHGRCFTRSIRVCSKTTERELLPRRGWCSGAVVRSSIRSLSLRHNGSRVCSCDRPAANGRLWAPPRPQHRLRPFTSGFGRTTPRSGTGRYSSISEAAVIGSADDSRQLPAPNA